MRQYALIGSLILATILAGCGGKKTTTPTVANVASNLVISPNSVSLTSGDVTSLSAIITDANNSLVTNPPAVTYSTSNTAVVNVSPGGLVCGGTWDASYIVCTPGPSGGATITATANLEATKSVAAATLTTTIPVFVHPRVDHVAVSPTSVNCISMGTKQQLTVQAFSNGQDVTAQVGPATWSEVSGSVVAVGPDGVATAQAPGQTTVAAQVSGVVSLPLTFVTCPVAQIFVHPSGSTLSNVTLVSGTSTQMVADVYDTKGVKIVPHLTWLSSQPIVASAGLSGQVTPLIPGTTEIGAACLPSNACNVNLDPTYGNLVSATLPGTETPFVLSASSSTTTLISTDMSTGISGTPVTLPYTPNSALISSTGQTELLGSSSLIMSYNASTSGLGTNAQALGTLLAGSPDLSGFLAYDSSRSALYVAGKDALSSPRTTGFAVPGVTAGDFSPDGSRAFFVAGANLYQVKNAAIASPVAMSAPGNDIAYLPTGHFVYVAGGAPSAVTVWATYDSSHADTISLPATPTHIRSLPDASQVIAVDGTGLDVITPSSSLVGLPPTVTDSFTRVDPGVGTFATRQLIVTPNSAQAVIVTDQPNLIVYTKSSGTTATIPIAGGATCYSGGPSLDSATLYLGCSDNAIHVFDLASMTDTKQVTLTITPDLNVIRAK